MNETDTHEGDFRQYKNEPMLKNEPMIKNEPSDWDDLEFDNASQTVSTNESSTPKPKSNLDEVIESVIQDAIDYADAPPEKRILPALVRKSTKNRSRQVNNNTNNSGGQIANNGKFSSVQNHQITTNNHTSNALMNQSIGGVNNTNATNTLHPLMQTNFAHPNMQQMAAQLQLAASAGKSIVSGGSGANQALMQHNIIGNAASVTNSQAQHQQLTAAMMGFGASQIPNMMMPTYNGNVPITYQQQMSAGQYQLPVTFAQIQQLQQQQQQQQSQQHQQNQQSHLLLGNSSISPEMTVGSNSQQSSMNFVTGSSTNPQQPQAMLPASYSNFSNQSITVTPYQIPGMMPAFGSPPSANSNPNTSTAVNLNGPVSNAPNSRYHSSTSTVSNNTTSSNSNNPSNTNISNVPNIALTTNVTSNSANNPNNANSNQNANQNNPNNNANNSSLNVGASSITAASMASLYQQLPPNAISPFDLHQQQQLYNQRLLQAQQQTLTQQSTNNPTAILSDYAVTRYSSYH